MERPSLLISVGPITWKAKLSRAWGLAVDRKHYRIGDSIRVQLSNSGGEPIGYNACPMARELLTGGGWQRIESLRVCAAVVHTLGRAASVNRDEEISAEWQAGTYRLVL